LARRRGLRLTWEFKAVADTDMSLAGIAGRQGATGEPIAPGPVDDPRRAYARRADDLLLPEHQVGLESLEGPEALQALLDRLTPAFEDAIVGLAVVSLEGQVLRVNKALASLMGRRSGDVETMNWKELVQADDAETLAERIARHLQEGDTGFELYGRFVRPDGEVRWALVNFSPVFDGLGTPVGLLGQVHDITYPMRLEESERAGKAELELRRAIAAAANEAQSVENAMAVALERICLYNGWPVGHIYLTTVDQKLMSTGIWYFTEGGQEAIRESLRVGTFNPRLSPPGSVLKTSKAVWLNDSADARGFAAGTAARERGLTGWAGFPILAATECVGVMEFYAALPPAAEERLVELMLDLGTQLGRVMERRRAEDERTEILIREQFLSSWFGSLLQSTGEGICGLDLDGQVSFVNRAGAELLGYTPDQLQGENLHEMSHHTRPDGTPYPRDRCPILRASRTGEGVRIDDEVFWRRDGTPFSVEYSSHAIIDLGGDIKGTVLTFTDITERRQEEQAVRALNDALLNTKEELENANLLKSDFLATMSHELRTPLNAIMGFAGLMQNGLAGEVTETGADYLERISRNSSVLLALINDVLDLSKIEANGMPLSPRLIDVRHIVRQVIENMQSLAENKGLALELEDHSADGMVIAHQRAVHQVITNLLSNAIKFTDQGSVTVQINARHGTTVVDVIDTGQGIAADEQAMVFDAFRQVGEHAHTSSGGTGLGLAISKRLAREMGGDLLVQSDLGHGSRFTLELATASVTPGLLGETGPAPIPVVLWVTSDFSSTARVRDWAGALGLGFVGIAAPELTVKAAVEMRPVMVALDLPGEVIGDMLSRVKDESKLESVPVLLVTDTLVAVAELRPGVRQLRRPFGRAQLHEALQGLRPAPPEVVD
jgi:PAS domain S-box-containing protein